jgi:hypothetical protein
MASLVLLESEFLDSCLSHRSPLCLPGEGRVGPLAGGNRGGRADLAASISSKKGWLHAQPGVLQRQVGGGAL